jgi:hypothetical protein
MHGLVLLELFHPTEPFFGDLDEVYRTEILLLMEQTGVDVSRIAK